MIKNIIFDLTGVVFTSDEMPFCEYYSKKTGLSVEEVDKAFCDSDIKFCTGELDDNGFLKDFFSAINLDIDNNFWKMKLEFKKKDQSVLDFIEELKKKFKVFYVTNEGKFYWDMQDKEHNLTKIFNGGIASFELGITKPDPKIFESLAKKYNLKAEECVFLDDSAKNLEGARQLGMQVLHFTGLEKLKQDLNNLSNNTP